ncbi:Abi family protein [Streptococcus infantis]|uniref:Abi family protein n=1 Tax=Streptococcus infantis TaxID=68892 RepID=UPI0039C17D6F
METKPFKTFREQIELLKSRGLTIRDENIAISILSTYSYYEIINGYKEIGIDQGEKFKEGATFEKLVDFFLMNKSIRTNINLALQEIEAHLRTVLSYVVAEHYTADQNKYLQRENYERGAKKFKESERSKFLRKCYKITQDKTQPYKHYREIHGNVPPWILVKGMTFGHLITFYKLQKSHIKTEVIQRMTGLDKENIDNDIKQLFINVFYFLLSYRNRCAHLGRVYNFTTEKNKINYNRFFHNRLHITEEDYKNGQGQNGLKTLIFSLTIFKTWGPVSPVGLLNFQIMEAINSYLLKYPEDRDYINQQIGGELIPIV